MYLPGRGTRHQFVARANNVMITTRSTSNTTATMRQSHETNRDEEQRKKKDKHHGHHTSKSTDLQTRSSERSSKLRTDDFKKLRKQKHSPTNAQSLLTELLNEPHCLNTKESIEFSRTQPTESDSRKKIQHLKSNGKRRKTTHTTRKLSNSRYGKTSQSPSRKGSNAATRASNSNGVGDAMTPATNHSLKAEKRKDKVSHHPIHSPSQKHVFPHLSRSLHSSGDNRGFHLHQKHRRSHSRRFSDKNAHSPANLDEKEKSRSLHRSGKAVYKRNSWSKTVSLESRSEHKSTSPQRPKSFASLTSVEKAERLHALRERTETPQRPQKKHKSVPPSDPANYKPKSEDSACTHSKTSSNTIKPSKDHDLDQSVPKQPAALPSNEATAGKASIMPSKKRKKKVKSKEKRSKKKSKKNGKKKKKSSKKKKTLNDSGISNKAGAATTKKVGNARTSCHVVPHEQTKDTVLQQRFKSPGRVKSHSGKIPVFSALLEQLRKLLGSRFLVQSERDSGLTVEMTTSSAEDSTSSLVLGKSSRRWSFTSSLAGHTSKSFVVLDDSGSRKNMLIRSKSLSEMTSSKKEKDQQAWYVRGADQKRPLARNKAFPRCNTMEMIFFEQ